MPIQELFSRIKQLALQPKDEIYPRYFLTVQSQKNLEEKQDALPQNASDYPQYLIAHEASIHACGVTTKGLLAAIHGLQYQHSTRISLKELNDQIHKHALALQESATAEIYTYNISLEGCIWNGDEDNFRSHSLAHNFIVIQYIDLDNKPRYRFYQSYIQQHSLKEFIERSQSDKNYDLSQSEFEVFLLNLRFISNAKTWHEEMGIFYRHHFKVESNYIGWKICKQINIDFSNIDEALKKRVLPKAMVLGTIQVQIESRRISLAASLEQWDDFQVIKNKQALPQIISLSPSDRNRVLFTKLMKAPAPIDQKSAIRIAVHDPLSGDYHYHSVDKKYLKTLQAFERLGPQDQVVYHSEHYDSTLAGKVSTYPSLFAETRALLIDKRKIFANTKAYLNKTGSLFADTRSLLKGNRPFLANVRRSFGLLNSNDIEKSPLGIETKTLKR